MRSLHSPRYLAVLICALALGVVAACGETGEKSAKRNTREFHFFRSEPDLRPIKVAVTKPADGTAPGYIFVSPRKTEKFGSGGAMIVDDTGSVIWYHPVPYQIADFRMQRYRGEPVLTWWEGKMPTVGIGSGEFVIMDRSYQRIAEIKLGAGLTGDLHEFLITPRNTAYVLAYERARADLTKLGGPKNAWVWDNVIQEIDIATRRVVFEWRSLDHVPVTESALRQPAKKASKKEPFDYFHVNSVDVDRDGHVLISARNTHGVYKINRRNGRVIWTLGGSGTDFKMGPGTKFAWQHDARRQRDGTITIFDNSAAPPVAKYSRAIVLRLDMKAKRATLVREFVHPKRVLSPHQGNVQVLPNGNVFVGWGGQPYSTEFAPDGTVVFDSRFAVGNSYRAYRFEWTGRPEGQPDVTAQADGDDRVTVYASWNGATEVARWEVLAGPSEDELTAVVSAERHRFETAIRVRTDEEFVAVRALDASGNTLGTSKAISTD